MEPLNAQTLRLHNLDVLAFFFSFYTFNRLLNPTNSSLNVSHPFFPITMEVIILLTTGTYLGATGSIIVPILQSRTWRFRAWANCCKGRLHLLAVLPHCLPLLCFLHPYLGLDFKRDSSIMGKTRVGIAIRAHLQVIFCQ